MTIKIYNKEEMDKHILSCYPEEACGFVHNNIFYPEINVAADKTKDFKISYHKYDTFQQKGGQLAVLHSHISDKSYCWYDRRTPSKKDMETQLLLNIPWAIVETEGENVSEPLWFGMKDRPDYEGREFIHSVQDCLVLTLDFMNQEFGLNLKNCPREVDWFMHEPLIDQNIEPWGFARLQPGQKPRYGDVILMKIRTDFINHLGIYIEEDKMLHHLINRLSYYDSITAWDRNICGYARHKELK